MNEVPCKGDGPRGRAFPYKIMLSIPRPPHGNWACFHTRLFHRVISAMDSIQIDHNFKSSQPRPLSPGLFPLKTIFWGKSPGDEVEVQFAIRFVRKLHIYSALLVNCHVIFCAEIFLLQMIIVTQLTPLSTVWLAIEIHPRLQNTVITAPDTVNNLIDARLLSNKCPSCAIVLWPTNQCSQ